MAPFKVIIIGSGLAGSLLANGLLNNDVEVQVYERLPRNAKRDGYHIRLGSSALKGLRACLTKDQLGDVVKKFGRANGQYAAAPILYNKDFKVILNANRFPDYDKSAPIGRKILRDILSGPLDQAGRLHYEKSIDRYEIVDPGTKNERVRVWLDDGSSDECDVLIAADGAHSKINKQVGLDNLKTATSHWFFMAKCDLQTDKLLQMPEETLKCPVLVSSDQRAIYVSAYLPDKVTEALATKESEPPQFDDSISSFFFAYTVPVEEVPKSIQETTLDEKWEFISSQFSRYSSPKFRKIIDILQGSDMYVYQARVSTPQSVGWRSKVRSEQIPEKGHPRVVLVGDAVHAMLPNRGMGGNQAMRDTSVLLPLLLDLDRKASRAPGLATSDIEAACKTYEAEMIPRAFDWVKKSGGDSPVMIDTSTLVGGTLCMALGLLLDIAYALYWLYSFFYKRRPVDDAPEFAG